MFRYTAELCACDEASAVCQQRIYEEATGKEVPEHLARHNSWIHLQTEQQESLEGALFFLILHRFTEAHKTKQLLSLGWGEDIGKLKPSTRKSWMRCCCFHVVWNMYTSFRQSIKIFLSRIFKILSLEFWREVILLTCCPWFSMLAC